MNFGVVVVGWAVASGDPQRVVGERRETDRRGRVRTAKWSDAGAVGLGTCAMSDRAKNCGRGLVVLSCDARSRWRVRGWANCQTWRAPAPVARPWTCAAGSRSRTRVVVGARYARTRSRCGLYVLVHGMAAHRRQRAARGLAEATAPRTAWSCAAVYTRPHTSGDYAALWPRRETRALACRCARRDRCRGVQPASLRVRA